MGGLEQHREVQAIARQVLDELRQSIRPTDTEQSIAARAVSLLEQRGISQTWYYACPALVLVGSRSCLSISGRQYAPSDEAVGPANLVTVDLSPLRDGVWGDCARSIFIECGRPVSCPQLAEFRRGSEMELQLHRTMWRFVSPTTTFDELHTFASEGIRSRGFENLDFLGNLGHSIPSRLEDRVYIEPGNSKALGDVDFFTFEPHIREVGGRWGFKRENVYYFGPGGRVEEL